MNRALPEMLHCLNTAGSITGNAGLGLGGGGGGGGAELMGLLQREQARLKWEQEHCRLQPMQQQQTLGYFGGNDQLNVFATSSGAPQFQGLMTGNDHDLGQLVSRPIKPDPGLDNGWTGFDNLGYGTCGFGNLPGSALSHALSRTTSCPPAVTEAEAAAGKRKETVPTEKLNSTAGRESFKKRKADKSQNLKTVAEEETPEKKMKVSTEEGESKITEQSSKAKTSSTTDDNNSNKEASADTSKEKSKVTEVQKPDYIHVRARRGQATDSHSLAERVRREKISERMKYLQDLVPGCNKITGKAGMLDEIINYVQSLQRQVEFLSMKLAAVNPRLDFDIESLVTKEMVPASTCSFPAIGTSSEMVTAANLHMNSVPQIVPFCGTEVSASPPDIALRRTISAPVSIPEVLLDATGFNQLQPSSTWDAELQSLYGVEFQQDRSGSLLCHQFSGL